jgi:hypothetical protein
MKKNRTTYLISLLLTLAVFISGFAATRAQQTEGEEAQQPAQAAGTDIGSGNQGAFIPAAVDPALFHAINIHRNELGWLRGEVIRRAVLLEATDVNGNVIANPNIRTYVFFKLNNSDVRAWNAGELSIMSRPTNSRTWQTCSAIPVGIQTTPQVAAEDTQTSQPRLACLTSQWNTYYALVRTDNQ